MQSINIERQNINIKALEAELRSILGELIRAVSISCGQTIVHLGEGALQGDIDLIEQIVNDHDEKLLTVEQQEKIDLEAERDSFATPFDPQAITLSELAARVAWLEREVRRLIGA
jgi:hypothetical protein